MDNLINEAKAATMLGVSKSKLQRDRWAHTGIAYVKIGKSIRYSQQVVEQFIAENTIIPTH